jgi:transcriptional regulator with XRE-family HTH domain
LILRKKKNITQNDFANKLGLKRTTITNYETGTSSPDNERLVAIAKILGVSIDDLLTKDLSSFKTGIVSETSTLYETPKYEGIPLLPIGAFAGISSNTDYSIMSNSIEDRYVVPLFGKTEVDFMIQVKGNSMQPKYNSGDVVACKFIKELTFIQWNKTYVIDTKSQGTIIKRLKKPREKDMVTCLSDNIEFDDFELPISEIRNVALVIGVIRLE